MSDYNISMGTLYEMNQQIMSQLAPMNDKMVDIELANVGVWFGSQRDFRYFMLLDKYRADYTVFNIESSNYHKATCELKALLQERGNILSVEYNHNAEYYEIWVDIDGTANMFVLFPCNDFIITID